MKPALRHVVVCAFALATAPAAFAQAYPAKPVRMIIPFQAGGLNDSAGRAINQSLSQLVDATVSALPTSRYQSVTRLSDLKGAHIGDQDGLGALYSANLVGSNATATKVRFIVIAASRGGVSIVVFAVDPAAPKDFPSGMPEGQQFDYLCQEFRWG